MSILKIITYPNKTLRAKSKKVDKANIKDGKYADLVTNMAETMVKKDGIGLAAPQIGRSIRLIVVNTKEGAMIMFNPELTKKSFGKDWDEEGCLSIPDTYGKVKRHSKVHCSFFDQNGKQRKIEAQGLLARVIQHEIDHLDGILFIDKAKNIQKKGPSL